MKKSYWIALGLAVVVYFIWTTDVAASMFDSLGIKRRPKPGTQGG